ncbi:nucleotidyltransferase family protein [Halodesulfurarchaeum sp.]|uniref:nucleotidyltransferase family protein n=1 Tax=Halodesulfurarchaeum sp. TaxID=1980530 RepID=UPI002FC396EF
MKMQSQARTQRLAGAKDDSKTIADGGQQESTTIKASDLNRDHPGPQTAVGGAILAAGKGERYEGTYKLLDTVEGEPLIRRAVAPFVASCLEETVLVVGHKAEEVRAAVSDLEVTVIMNEAYEDGQSTSLRQGVEVARERGWDAIVYGLGDMPFVDADTIDVVVQGYLENNGEIIAPAYEGKRGNPTLFGSDTYEALSAVTGDTGGRPVLRSRSDLVVLETDDPGVLRDIDVKSDL